MFFGVWKVTQRTNLTEKTTLRIFLNIFRFLYNFILYISSSSSEVPRYCFIRALELLERYRNPPLVPQLILPLMTISCPVLNNVTVRITSLGLDVMNGQQRHSGLFKALLHLVTQFLAFSGVFRCVHPPGATQQILDILPLFESGSGWFRKDLAEPLVHGHHLVVIILQDTAQCRTRTTVIFRNEPVLPISIFFFLCLLDFFKAPSLRTDLALTIPAVITLSLYSLSRNLAASSSYLFSACLFCAANPVDANHQAIDC